MHQYYYLELDFEYRGSEYKKPRKISHTYGKDKLIVRG